MQITVALCSEPLFTWEATDAELEKLTADFETMATQTGHTAIVVAKSMMQVVCQQGGLPLEEPERRGAMAWIIYCLLQTDTQNPEHPGKYRDYVFAWDFSFDLLPLADCVDIDVRGHPSATTV
jgi:hypothetical protein